LPDVPLQNPSSTVVSSLGTLYQNISENAENAFCQGVLGAGAYTVGSTILGNPLPKPPQLYAIGGLLLAGFALCPSSPTQAGLYGKPPLFSGGQCGVNYTMEANWRYYADQSGNTSAGGTSRQDIPGPISQVGEPPIGLKLPYDPNTTVILRDANGYPILQITNGFGIVGGSFNVFVRRRDGQPDNCGNAPNSGAQIITNNISGDTVNSNNVGDTTTNNYIVPITFAYANFSSVINVPIGGIKIGSLFPLNFSLNFGGVRIGFGANKDGNLEPRPVNPDPSQPENSDEILQKIYAELVRAANCVCTPPVNLDMLHLPLVEDSVSCDIVSETLLVPTGSVSDVLFAKILRSAELAREKCLDSPTPQKPEALIFAASTTQDGREIFTGEIAPEVHSLRLKITEIRDDGPEKLSIYEASNQRKFGSVSFVLSNILGGGDYLYVFDTETYVPLPVRGQPGKLRVLMKKGLSFEVYDTGERV
jgi:hypothetical protein